MILSDAGLIISRLKVKQEQIQNDQITKFSVDDDNKLYFLNRICALNNSEVLQDILHKVDSDKMYNDLRQSYLYSGVKCEILEFELRHLI